jgi:4-aminobutyrate aminotransferase/(S)-3-amino-2-methylpropionate transaminase
MARRVRALPAGVGTTVPVFIERAGGGVLVDVDGNSLIDFSSGIAVVNAGNAHPDVVEAVTEQARRFTHTAFQIAPYESYVAVCERLNELTPGDHEKRSILVNSGAEAVENAVKVARHYTKRPAVVVLDHAFHGRTLLTMSLTGKSNPYKRGFGPFAPEVYRLPMAYPYRWSGGPERAAEEAAAEAIDLMRTQLGAGSIACVIAEPIQGEGGFIVPAPGFLPAIAEFCREEGILFVADEVQTGFCRTGAWFASEHEGLVPDLITTAKGIADGLPLGGVTGRAEIMDEVHPGGLGGTFSGNPLACAAALASIEVMRREDLAARARHIESLMLPRLRALAETFDVVGDVRGRGAMLAIELVADRASKKPAPELVSAVMAACLREGLVVLKAGTYDNVLRFLPPLVTPDDLIEQGVSIIEQALREVTSG